MGEDLGIATMTDLTAQQILDAMDEAVKETAQRFGSKKKPVWKRLKSTVGKSNGKSKATTSRTRTTRK